jgi:hypothetical protein
MAGMQSWAKLKIRLFVAIGTTVHLDPTLIRIAGNV